MKFMRYMDSHSSMRVELDSDDVEIAKLLLKEKTKFDVIKEFITNGFSTTQAVATVSEAIAAEGYD